MKLKLPNSWSAVTLREFQAISKLFEDYNEMDKTARSEFELECALISTVSGAGMDEVLQLTMGSHNHIMNQLAFLSTDVTGKLHNKARANGRKYYFETNPRKITSGQWITLNHFLQDERKVNDNLHNILACFAYDVKWWRYKYDGKNHNRVANDMLELPIDFVKPLTDFFLRDWMRSLKNTAVYLETKGKMLKRQAVKELARSKVDTGGSIQSMD